MAIRAKLTLAEAATQHADGTISMLRSGITHVLGEAPPYLLAATLVVRIEAEIGDAGAHKFDVRCIDEDGTPILPPIEGSFEAHKGGGVNMLILGFRTAFQKIGRFVFVVHVDKQELDRWVITVGKQENKA